MRGRWWLWMSVTIAVLASGLLFVALGPGGATPVTSADSTSSSTSPAIQVEQFDVSSVTVSETTVDVDGSVHVEAVIENNGDEAGDVDVSLAVDGDVVETVTAEHVQPEFPVLAQFDHSFDEAGTYEISVNGVQADSPVEVFDTTDENTEASPADEGESTDDEDSDTGIESETSPDQFTITGVTLDDSKITLGESVQVIAHIEVEGEDEANYEVTLAVDGTPELTERIENVQPHLEPELNHTFVYEPDEAGTFMISVNGVEADSTLTVEEPAAESSGTFGFLSFLPLGLIQMILLFVGLPILLVYLSLKTLAIYLGY